MTRLSLEMIAVTCHHCSARYKLSDELYDKKGVGFGVIVTCRHCRAEIFVRRPGETSAPTAEARIVSAVPHAPLPPKPDSLPPPALPLTKRKRLPSNLGPPRHDGADLPEVIVDLSDLEAAEPTDVESEHPAPHSRSPLPVAPRAKSADAAARGRGVLFVTLALLGAGAAGVFGFILRGALPVNARSSPPPSETVVRALEPPGPTTPEPGDVALDEPTENDPGAARVTARANSAVKSTAARENAPEDSPTPDETPDAGAPEEAGSEETTNSEPAEPAGPFDRAAASTALGRAASEASACRRDGDPSGMAAVTITYSPSGRVTTATVAGPPFSGTATGGCIAATFRKAVIPPFSGELVTVKKTVTIQ